MEDESLSILASQRSQSPDTPIVIDRGELLRCHNFACSCETYEPEKICPMCGRNMLGSQAFRILGGILIFLGILLAGIGGSLLYFLIPKLPKNDDGRSTVAIAIFVALLAAGLIVITAGVSQTLSGKKNRGLLTAMVVAFGVLLFFAAVARWIF